MAAPRTVVTWPVKTQFVTVSVLPVRFTNIVPMPGPLLARVSPLTLTVAPVITRNGELASPARRTVSTPAPGPWIATE